ncbi:MAG: 4-alpha-glucanotransferase, partial [Lachnospiraceae bacterium]|nr:4-alpha-glucanotransferase [Lachnospiraceae bacterium]
DHFRGFDEYFAVPYGAKTEADGVWQPGPGMKLFHALKDHFGSVPIIAEDLGLVTESVRRLVSESGYTGMKVVEFAFDSSEAGDYMPYNYPQNCVVYTGTHDNQTLAAWYDELTKEDRALAAEYLCLDDRDRRETVWAFIRLTLASVADTAVIPMQDYLCLGAEARMNQPSTLGTNWAWRMLPGEFTEALARKIRRVNEVYGRTGIRADS